MRRLVPSPALGLWIRAGGSRPSNAILMIIYDPGAFIIDVGQTNLAFICFNAAGTRVYRIDANFFHDRDSIRPSQLGRPITPMKLWVAVHDRARTLSPKACYSVRFWAKGVGDK